MFDAIYKAIDPAHLDQIDSEFKEMYASTAATVEELQTMLSSGVIDEETYTKSLLAMASGYEYCSSAVQAYHDAVANANGDEAVIQLAKDNLEAAVLAEEAATKLEDAYSHALSGKSSMTIEDLNLLKESNAELYNSFLTMSDDEWYEAAYQAQADLLESRMTGYAQDSAEYRALMIEKQTLDEEYYSYLQDKNQEAFDALQEQREAQIDAAYNVMSSMQSSLNSSGPMSFVEIEELTQGLEAAGVEAERVKRIVDSIGETEDGSAEQIKAKMIAATEAALMAFGTQEAQKEEIEGVVFAHLANEEELIKEIRKIADSINAIYKNGIYVLPIIPLIHLIEAANENDDKEYNKILNNIIQPITYDIYKMFSSPQTKVSQIIKMIKQNDIDTKLIGWLSMKLSNNFIKEITFEENNQEDVDNKEENTEIEIVSGFVEVHDNEITICVEQ